MFVSGIAALLLKSLYMGASLLLVMIVALTICMMRFVQIIWTDFKNIYKDTSNICEWHKTNPRGKRGHPDYDFCIGGKCDENDV